MSSSDLILNKALANVTSALTHGGNRTGKSTLLKDLVQQLCLRNGH